MAIKVIGLGHYDIVAREIILNFVRVMLFTALALARDKCFLTFLQVWSDRIVESLIVGTCSFVIDLRADWLRDCAVVFGCGFVVVVEFRVGSWLIAVRPIIQGLLHAVVVALRLLLLAGALLRLLNFFTGVLGRSFVLIIRLKLVVQHCRMRKGTFTKRQLFEINGSLLTFKNAIERFS